MFLRSAWQLGIGEDTVTVWFPGTWHLHKPDSWCHKYFIGRAVVALFPGTDTHLTVVIFVIFQATAPWLQEMGQSVSGFLGLMLTPTGESMPWLRQAALLLELI